MQDKKYLLSIAQLLEAVPLEEQQKLIKGCLKWLDDERMERLKHLVGAEVSEMEKAICGSIQKKRKAVEILGAGMLLQLAVMQAENGDMDSVCSAEITHLTITGLLTCLEEAGQRPLHLEYTYGTKGKPFLKNFPYYFNVSHSGEYIFCVISEHEVGVDIQQEKPLQDDRIARRFFSEEEKQALAACKSPQERQKLFYRLWACKEAYGKLTGQGVATVLETEMGLLHNILYDDVGTDNFKGFKEYIIEEYQINDYRIAICKWRQEP